MNLSVVSFGRKPFVAYPAMPTVCCYNSIFYITRRKIQGSLKIEPRIAFHDSSKACGLKS